MLTRRLWSTFAPGHRLRAARPHDDRGVLGNWGALSFPTQLGDVVILANQRTMLCALAPLGSLEDMVVRLRSVVRAELERLGVPLEKIESEDDALADLSLAKSSDRSLLGSMNDLAGHVQWYVEDELAARRRPDIERIQLQLNETPHVKREPAFAEDAIRRLFLLQ
jgi:hypothetical protein